MLSLVSYPTSYILLGSISWQTMPSTGPSRWGSNSEWYVNDWGWTLEEIVAYLLSTLTKLWGTCVPFF